jgi:hypothetical protein
LATTLFLWILKQSLFFIVAILYAIDKNAGTIAFWIWILFLAGVPLCIGEYFSDKK